MLDFSKTKVYPASKPNFYYMIGIIFAVLSAASGAPQVPKEPSFPEVIQLGLPGKEIRIKDLVKDEKGKKTTDLMSYFPFAVRTKVSDKLYNRKGFRNT